MASDFMRNVLFAIILTFISFSSVSAQGQPSSSWATDVGSRYWVQPDIVYQGANNQLLKLDVWYQHDVKTPSPTLVYIHGGGWIFGTKEGSILQFLPFLEKGWTVVNVEYRMASSSLAPAAVEDTRCALRWVYRNAQQWQIAGDRHYPDRYAGGYKHTEGEVKGHHRTLQDPRATRQFV